MTHTPDERMRALSLAIMLDSMSTGCAVPVAAQVAIAPPEIQQWVGVALMNLAAEYEAAARGGVKLEVPLPRGWCN